MYCINLEKEKSLPENQKGISQEKMKNIFLIATLRDCCKVPIMQNYSISYFFLEHVSLDLPFRTDHQYLFTFSICQNFHAEKC